MIRVTIDAATGTEVDLKFTGAGKAYARFRAVSKERKRGNDGTWQDGDETWFSVTVFGKAAEMLAESNPEKGTRVLIDGKAKLEEWTDSQGNARHGLSVIADHVGLEVLFTAYDKKGAERSARGAAERRDGDWFNDPSQGSFGGFIPEEPPF